MAKIGVIGAGSWGTALAKTLASGGHDVTVWSIAEDEVRMLNEEHEQKVKLPGVILPETVTATTDLGAAVSDKDLLVLVVPSPFIRSTAKKLAAVCPEGQKIVCAAKGIEEETLLPLSEVILSEIPSAQVGILSGPTHAEEVGIGLPTTIVAGAQTKEYALYLQEIFMSPVFRVYISPDMLGMQIGAALKNVVALAAGIADGLGYGDNTKAALITRGIAEITRLGVKMGGSPETFAGLTGIGDLIVTCASMHSRNRRAGILIGKGASASEAMEEVGQVVEGVFSAKAARALAEKYGVDMPIITQVCRVLFEGADPSEAVQSLMMRDGRAESSALEWKQV